MGKRHVVAPGPAILPGLGLACASTDTHRCHFVEEGQDTFADFPARFGSRADTRLKDRRHT